MTNWENTMSMRDAAIDAGLFFTRLARVTANVFREAWEVMMGTIFAAGEKYNFWTLRKATEPKGAPHMTRRMAKWIQTTALTIQGIAVMYGLYKLFLLYVYGRA